MPVIMDDLFALAFLPSEPVHSSRANSPVSGTPGPLLCAGQIDIFRNQTLTTTMVPVPGLVCFGESSGLAHWQ